jgi:acetoin utilization deacetylase AcuC-like enzyme
MHTGIFFHYQQGERLKDFPEALHGILEKEEVFFYDAFYPDKPESLFDLPPIPTEAIHRVHSPEMVERVKRAGVYEGALYSAAGTYSAALRVWSGEITNAFVFTGYGDHHAGSHFFGGGCYFNAAAIAIRELKARNPNLRFAVVDTDAHHGDGSWELFEKDFDVLYLCFCSEPKEERNNNVNIHIHHRLTDNEYLSAVGEAFQKWVTPFRPEMIFWNWGYDGTVGEYGDMGLSPACQVRLARLINETAWKLCEGRVIVVLCGGSRRDLAFTLIPKIIRILIADGN